MYHNNYKCTLGTNKKTGRQKGETPRKRAQSAPPAKVGRDVWMNAVKKRQTQTLVRSRPESPRHKTSTEYWVDTLRKTGIGKKSNKRCVCLSVHVYY